MIFSVLRIVWPSDERLFLSLRDIVLGNSAVPLWMRHCARARMPSAKAGFLDSSMASLLDATYRSSTLARNREGIKSMQVSYPSVFAKL